MITGLLVIEDSKKKHRRIRSSSHFFTMGKNTRTSQQKSISYFNDINCWLPDYPWF